MKHHVIGSRTYCLADLRGFAAVSGDWNPIHVDPLVARRLVTGEVVAHGTLVLLWALDCHFATATLGLRAITASFRRPVLLGSEIILTKEIVAEREVRLVVSQRDQEIAVFLLQEGSGRNDGALASRSPDRLDPQVWNFVELKDASGLLPIEVDTALVHQGFPRVVSALGMLPVAAMAGLSRLAGMHCPGLNSLVTAVNLAFEPTVVDTSLRWRVTRCTVAQAPIRITATGGGMALANIEVLVRASPVEQLSMKQVAMAATNAAAHGDLALVIGGSRGLGEVTAKLVAAAGGEVIASYFQGEADAQRVATEITAWGGKCSAVQFNADAPENAIDLLRAGNIRPTHVYYFASPPIRRGRGPGFDAVQFAVFIRLYVEGFARLVVALGDGLGASVKIFYPSTTFIDELPREFPEYIAAKAAGEALCRHLQQHRPTVEVLVRRLPRLPTDQTAGLAVRQLTNPLPELTRVVQEMHS